jgi:hypothetical protein
MLRTFGDRDRAHLPRRHRLHLPLVAQCPPSQQGPVPLRAKKGASKRKTKPQPRERRRAPGRLMLAHGVDRRREDMRQSQHLMCGMAGIIAMSIGAYHHMTIVSLLRDVIRRGVRMEMLHHLQLPKVILVGVKAGVMIMKPMGQKVIVGVRAHRITIAATDRHIPQAARTDLLYAEDTPMTMFVTIPRE